MQFAGAVLQGTHPTVPERTALMSRWVGGMGGGRAKVRLQHRSFNRHPVCLATDLVGAWIGQPFGIVCGDEGA